MNEMKCYVHAVLHAATRYLSSFKSLKFRAFKPKSIIIFLNCHESNEKLCSCFSSCSNKFRDFKPKSIILCLNCYESNEMLFKLFRAVTRYIII